MAAARWLQSLQARVLVATLVGMALALSLTGWGLQHLFRQHVERQFDTQLQWQLNQVLARLVFDDGGTPHLPPQSLVDPRWTQPLSGLYWQISEADGTVARRSRSLWDQTLALSADNPADGTVHRHHAGGPNRQWLTVLEQSVLSTETTGPPRRWIVAVATDTEPLEASVRTFTGALVATLALLLLLLTGAGVAQVAYGLAPLRSMQRSLERLNAGQTQRLEGPWPSEVQPLAHGFNQALDRLDQNLIQARTQAGNLAHALKTPLAVLRQAAEAVHDGDDPQGLAPRVLEQVDIAYRQVERHLRRARSAALAGHRLRTPLAPVLDGLQRVMAKIHPDTELTLHPADTTDAVCVAADGQDLHDMLGNLLDNACQWARSRVRVSWQGNAQAVTIDVEDDGPGIPAEHLQRVLERGERLDERSPGSGLGLSIVDELARLHGGQLHIHPPGSSDWGGLRVSLVLPVAGDSP